MKSQLIFYLVFTVCVLLSSLGNDVPGEHVNKLKERNEVIQTLINDIWYIYHKQTFIY